MLCCSVFAELCVYCIRISWYSYHGWHLSCAPLDVHCSAAECGRDAAWTTSGAKCIVAMQNSCNSGAGSGASMVPEPTCYCAGCWASTVWIDLCRTVVYLHEFLEL